MRSGVVITACATSLSRRLPAAGGRVTGYSGYVSTGVWLTDNEGTRWFFDSGALSLDFGYTGDYGYDRPAWEQLHGPDDLTAWLTGRFGALRAPATDAMLAEAFRLRAAITGVARALADGQRPHPGAIDTINAYAAGADIAPVLLGGRADLAGPDVARALATIARDAVVTLGRGPSHIRRCGADKCALIFLDSSRPNSRRWCSMQRCGNRTKARSHRARAQQPTT
jgi:predicted RNA-binding Zn ribbon-like protein